MPRAHLSGLKGGEGECTKGSNTFIAYQFTLWGHSIE